MINFLCGFAIGLLLGLILFVFVQAKLNRTRRNWDDVVKREGRRL